MACFIFVAQILKPFNSISIYWEYKQKW